MALEGTIRDFGLPDIFQLIGLQRKTGILTLKNEKDQVTVAFENGMVVAADSSTKRLEDRLGNVLVKQGKLSKERLDDALLTQKATLQRLGHVLTTQNAITDKDLKEAITVQISQLVFKVFRWRDGEYHFAPTDTVDYDRENFAPMSADFILMEGIRMVDEWPIIEKKIPSMDIVFRTAVDPGTIEVAVADADPGDAKHSAASASNKIRLSREEERVFRKVDGTRTVQGIVDSSGLAEFDTCRILFDLLNRNLISTVGRGAKVAETSRREAVVSSTPGYILAAAAVAAGRWWGSRRGRRRRSRWWASRRTSSPPTTACSKACGTTGSSGSTARCSRITSRRGRRRARSRRWRHAGWWTAATSRTRGRGRSTTPSPPPGTC